MLTSFKVCGNIPLALNERRRQDARVVELADSLDSGSSVHYARAGSSPASRTIEKPLKALAFKGFLYALKLGFPYFFPYALDLFSPLTEAIKRSIRWALSCFIRSVRCA